MHFDSESFTLADQLPKGILARVARAQDTASGDYDAGLPRRSFLKLTVASGFALGAYPLIAGAQAPAAAAGLQPFEQPSAFVRIDKDGAITVTINRLEFGQGVLTALPMCLAEELDADWSKVQAVHGDATAAYVDPLFGMHMTGGSGSIKHSFMQYRELGARARAMLVSAAAAQWGVDASSLRTDKGMVLGTVGKSISYGELSEAAMKMPVPRRWC